MLGKNQGKSRRPKKRDLADKAGDSGSSPDSLTTASQSIIPPKIGSELSMIRFADAVEPATIEIVLRCKSISVSSRAPFPFKTYQASSSTVVTMHTSCNTHTSH